MPSPHRLLLVLATACLSACAADTVPAEAKDRPALTAQTPTKQPPEELRSVTLASGVVITIATSCRVTSKDKDGAELWPVAVGDVGNQPRSLSVTETRLTVVYGKHSFAQLDLTTGKFIGSGSD